MPSLCYINITTRHFHNSQEDRRSSTGPQPSSTRPIHLRRHFKMKSLKQVCTMMSQDDISQVSIIRTHSSAYWYASLQSVSFNSPGKIISSSSEYLHSECSYPNHQNRMPSTLMSTSQRNTSSLLRWLTYRGQSSLHIRQTHQDGTAKAPRAGILRKSGQVFTSSIPSVSPSRVHNRFQTPYIDGTQSKGADLRREATRLLHRQSCTNCNLAASIGSLNWQGTVNDHDCFPSQAEELAPVDYQDPSIETIPDMIVSSGDSDSGQGRTFLVVRPPPLME